MEHLTPWGAIVTGLEIALAVVLLILFVTKKDKQEDQTKQKEDYFRNKYGKHNPNQQPK